MMDFGKFLKQCPICSGSSVCHERVLNNVELVRCQVCDFVYANVTDEYIKMQNSDFDECATVSYEENQTLVDKLWFKRIVKKITDHIGCGSVLDVGCGNGVLLKNFLDKGWKASGIDLSLWAEKSAQRYGYKLYLCELERANLPDNCFDVVVSTSTLEHIPQPFQHIKEILRVVKPDGLAYFSGIPNYGSLSVRLKVSGFRNNKPPKHVNYFTYRSMCNLFSRPEIADKINSVSIATYGIPELHKLYGLLRNAIRRTPRRLKHTGTDAYDKPQQHSTSKPPLLVKSIEMLVALNYYSGQIFHLGDKLEAMVIKRH
jgi:2-polyprenyl-3-methyl-5-hydroxy-6-metoxy-1,4-benzoquinol methylase